MEEFKEEYDFFYEVDMVIIQNKKLIKDKLNLYCKYCLSLGKEYLDSERPGLYEKCKKFLKSNK